MSQHRITPHPPADPASYNAEVYQRGLRYERPAFTFDSTKWEAQAKERLSAESWGYVYGSAGHAETKDKNLAAFRKWSLVPSRMVEADMPKLETTVLGQKLPFPLALAPVGVLRIFHNEGEKAVASAAAAESIPYILSTAASTSIEDAAEANGDGLRWFQLYWPSNKDDEITISMLRRAKAAGYKALFVTLDTYILGWRPMDMDDGYNPFLRADNIGVEIGFTDPVFQQQFKDQNGKSIAEDTAHAAAEWAHKVFPGRSHSWEDVKFLQKHWDGPIVLKGIQTVADARKAAEIGVQGIVVSNHGGRQVDGSVASLDCLPPIVDAVGDKLDIIYDSGIRCGADAVKALALGAKLVLLGRPYVYGLALGGEAGVKHVIRSMLGDMELTMHLSGITSVSRDDLNRERLVRET